VILLSINTQILNFVNSLGS